MVPCPQKYSIQSNLSTRGLSVAVLLIGLLPVVTHAQDSSGVLLYRKAAPVQLGRFDTVVTGAILYEGDTIPFRALADIYIWGGTPAQYARMMEKWTRLRNAVYVTYP